MLDNAMLPSIDAELSFSTEFFLFLLFSVNKSNSMQYLADWNVSCGKINLIGTIREDSAPFLYPFLVEYSLIGVVVLYIMWKHVGLNPK